MIRNTSADEVFRVENSAAAGSIYAKYANKAATGQAAAAPTSVYSVSAPVVTAPVMTAPQAPVPGSADAWQQYQDISSGKSYWHNSESGQTTWDDPSAGKVVNATPYVDAKGEYKPISPPNTPVVMTWSGVSVLTIPRLQVGQGFKWSAEKALLNNISGTITGGLWGIMGPSGGGKTTLLSVLSLRLDTQRMRMVGDVCINGKKFNRSTLKNMSGYVMQDDLVMPTLTVHETLMYTAALRMPRYCTLAQREARVEEVLKLMGIEYTRDVIVGDSRNKGISGGERKRLCVAMELLPKPTLLFLDEPTSGLDSTTALSLMIALKDLSNRGECTVVCTIHQPQTKIYNLLDNLILMRKGEIVYQGPCSKAEQYMAEAGYPCPNKTNPADHMLDVVILGSEMNDGKTEPVRNLSVPVNLDLGLDLPAFSARGFPLWFWQFFVLTHRNVADKFRRWDIVATNIAVSLIVGAFIGCGAWYNIAINPDPVGVTYAFNQFGIAQPLGTSNPSYIEINAPFSKINAIQFFTVIHQGVISSLQGTHAFPLERALMLRERQAGTYYCSAYFLSKVAVDSFFQLLAPITFTAVTYPVINLSTVTYDKAGIYLGFQMLLNNAAVALSNMCSCLAVSIELSTVVLAMFMEITRLYSAFFVSPLALDGFPIWSFWDQVSYMKFSYTGLTVNQYSGMSYYCTPAQLQNINFVRVNAATSASPIVTLPTMPIDTSNPRDRAIFGSGSLCPATASTTVGTTTTTTSSVDCSTAVINTATNTATFTYPQKPYCKYSSGAWCAACPATGVTQSATTPWDGKFYATAPGRGTQQFRCCPASNPTCCSFAEGGWFNPLSTYRVPTGENVMITFGYQRYTTQYCGGCLIVYIMVCRVISYLALRFIKV